MAEQEKNEIRLQVGELATKEDTGKNKIEVLDKIKEELSERIALAENHTPLIKRINSLADEYKHFAGDVSKKIISIENIKPLLEKRVDELTKTLQSLIKKEIEPFNKLTESLEKKIKETRLDYVNEILTDVTTKIAVIESKLNSMEKNYGKKVTELPKMQEKIIIREPRFLEEQFKELINRMIFLESRLIAVESMMHEKYQTLPIIIE